MIILSRQARDKHREDSQTRSFSQVHVGASGAVEAAAGLFEAAGPSFPMSAINCETNAGSHDLLRGKKRRKHGTSPFCIHDLISLVFRMLSMNWFTMTDSGLTDSGNLFKPLATVSRCFVIFSRTALNEAADLIDWFTADTATTDRLYARTASFCTGGSSQWDAW